MNKKIGAMIVAICVIVMIVIVGVVLYKHFEKKSTYSDYVESVQPIVIPSEGGVDHGGAVMADENVDEWSIIAQAFDALGYKGNLFYEKYDPDADYLEEPLPVSYGYTEWYTMYTEEGTYYAVIKDGDVILLNM